MPPAPAAPISYGRKNPLVTSLVRNTRLSGDGSAKDVRQFGFALPENTLTYDAGDALGVWPRNSPPLVEAFLETSGLDADTVVTVGSNIMPKAELLDEASQCLRMLSGRAHRVYTGLALVTPRGQMRQRVVETRVRFKRLTREDMDRYLASGEWRGKAGGYAIQGLAGGFVVRLVGSYSNVVGLPLYETLALLQGEGFRQGMAAAQ